MHRRFRGPWYLEVNVLKASSMALGGAQRFKKSKCCCARSARFMERTDFRQSFRESSKEYLWKFWITFRSLFDFRPCERAGVVGTGQRTACTLKTSSTCHCGRQPVVGECMQVRERICVYCIVGWGRSNGCWCDGDCAPVDKGRRSKWRWPRWASRGSRGCRFHRIWNVICIAGFGRNRCPQRS